jgi:hypothetical protein
MKKSLMRQHFNEDIGYGPPPPKKKIKLVERDPTEENKTEGYGGTQIKLM